MMIFCTFLFYLFINNFLQNIYSSITVIQSIRVSMQSMYIVSVPIYAMFTFP